jgi:RNA polymerase sigma factor (sigma-70 family)
MKRSTPVAELRQTNRRAEALSVASDPLDLTARLRSGDQEAMAEIFRDSLDRVWRHRRRSVEVDGSPLPWIYGIATNVCRNHHRSGRRADRANARMELVDTATDRDPADAPAGRVDAARRLKSVLERLAGFPPADQDVWEQLSYTEAAAALSIPVGTVRSRLARVRRELRDLAEGEEMS